MDITASHAGVRASRAAPGLVPAGVLLVSTLISMIGANWDIQWHTDVGPDTFFTVPHLFLYAGAAIDGLVSLWVVLAATAAQRAGREVDPLVGGRPVRVFGVFTAPVGYLISGAGAASFLLYGLWDLWWHGLYGFDAVIASPPHVGLFLSGTVSSVGKIMVFAAARQQRWGAVGLVVAVATFLASSMTTVRGLEQLNNGVVNVITVAAAFSAVLLVVLGAVAVGRPGGALAVAVVVAAVQAVFWWFDPWAARAYADAVGLPVRDYTSGIPVVPSFLPMSLVLVALVVEAARRLSVNRAAAVLAGAVGAALVAVGTPIQNAWVLGLRFPPLAPVLATTVVAAVFGLLAGFLGWRLGVMLRVLDAQRSELAREGR